MKFLISSNHRDLSHQQAYIFLVITVFLWAVGVVIARGVREEIPLVGLSFWRWFSAFLLLLPFVIQTIWQNSNEVKQHMGIYIKQGALMVGSGTLLFYALNFTTAINASLVNATQPVVTVFLAWILLGQTHTKLQSAGVLFALAGIAAMVTRMDWQNLAGLDFNIGDLLVIIAIFGYGLYAVNIPRMPHDLGAMTNLSMICLFGSLAILPFYITETLLVKAVTFNQTFIITTLVLSILMSIISMRLWNLANAVVGPGRAAVFVNLVPVFGAILAVLFLSESLYLYHIIGAVMVCCGIFMVVSNLKTRDN